MMRAYALLFLLLITGVLRAASLAQEPTPQSPTTKRQSFVAEIMRQRLSPPTITAPVETAEEPILRIETVVLRLPDPNAGLKKSHLESLSGLYETALFQRQRFRETGQPIEFERGNLFFHQDRYVVTKGLILYRIQNDRIDFGLYQRGFHSDASPDHARAQRSDPRHRGNDHGDERQYFFGVRFRLGKSPHQDQ
ncbi:MAG TPA: hypothetical protein VE715_00675 [Blastocatellia bacterium]|nr:hypothetical protein [Blastocatellia bacterium]